jgi:hypothetical protein
MSRRGFAERMRRRRFHRAAGVVLAAALGLFPRPLIAAVLQSADIAVTIDSARSCLVTMSLSVAGAREVEHRIERFDGARVDLIETHGARLSGGITTIGRTQSLVLLPDGPAYSFRYRAEQPDQVSDRCPLWLPTVATDGRSRDVHLSVDLPAGGVAYDSMPALTWTDGHGEVALRHLPAIVRVAYSDKSSARGWSVASLMDTLTIAIFAAATAFWTWRMRR